jgi:hypothetical protein
LSIAVQVSADKEERENLKKFRQKKLFLGAAFEKKTFFAYAANL